MTTDDERRASIFLFVELLRRNITMCPPLHWGPNDPDKDTRKDDIKQEEAREDRRRGSPRREHPWREYGLGNSDPFVKSPPRVIGKADVDGAVCPNCKCDTLYELEVDVEHPALRGTGKGIGRYTGCPACPFATPMLMRAV